MNIVERVKRICLTPNTEWPVIAAESTSAGALISGYVLPLAGISAIAGFIGGSLVGHTLPFIGTYRVPIVAGLAAAVVGVVMTVAGVFVMSLIINALAPTFGAQKNSDQALKVAVYSFTPAWVAGVFMILPALGMLAALGGLYGLYLLYLGLPRLMKCPDDKAVGYTVVTVICAIVVSAVIAMTGGMIGGAGMMGAGAMSGLTGANSPTTADVVVDPNSPLGALQGLGQGLEESARKMEAAEKSGDQSAQVAAAMEGLGALLGGGRRVEPVDIEELKGFVPETFAGLPRTRSSAEKTGIVGVMVSKAEASYGDGAQKNVTLEVTDSGGASGLAGLASWMNVQEERQSDDGFERTQKVGDRLVREKSSKSGNNEFAIVVGNRFIVSTRGRGVDLNELKAAASSLDLGRLESMRDAGVQR
jgi:hypothetical protein